MKLPCPSTGQASPRLLFVPKVGRTRFLDGREVCTSTSTAPTSTDRTEISARGMLDGIGTMTGGAPPDPVRLSTRSRTVFLHDALGVHPEIATVGLSSVPSLCGRVSTVVITRGRLLNGKTVEAHHSRHSFRSVRFIVSIPGCLLSYSMSLPLLDDQNRPSINYRVPRWIADSLHGGSPFLRSEERGGNPHRTSGLVGPTGDYCDVPAFRDLPHSLTSHSRTRRTDVTNHVTSVLPSSLRSFVVEAGAFPHDVFVPVPSNQSCSLQF